MSMKNRKGTLSKNILERLTLNNKFVLQVRATRIKLGIPPDGFASNEEYSAWLMNKPHKSARKIFVQRMTAQEKFLKLLVREAIEILSSGGSFVYSPVVLPTIRQYLTKGENISQGFLEYPNIDLQSVRRFSYRDLEKEKTYNPHGALIIVESHVSKDELLSFCDKHYGKIRIAMRSKKRPPRLRMYSKRDRDKKIIWRWYNYSQRSIHELRILADLPHAYKYEAISIILEKKHGINVKPDTLRTIISRSKRRGLL